MQITKQYPDHLTFQVLSCAIGVHRHLGPGLLENVYEKCLLRKFKERGIIYHNQFHVPIDNKGLSLDAHLRLDVSVEDILCVQLKAQEGILPASLTDSA